MPLRLKGFHTEYAVYRRVCACVRTCTCQPASLPARMCFFGGQIILSAAADKSGAEEWENAGCSCRDFSVPNYKANNHGPSPLAGSARTLASEGLLLANFGTQQFQTIKRLQGCLGFFLLSRTGCCFQSVSLFYPGHRKKGGLFCHRKLGCK